MAGVLVAGSLGLSTELYTGLGADWAPAVGGVLYVVFWTMIVLSVRPALSPWWAAAGVFVGTCLLETLQLWQPAPLEAIRSTFIGDALIGTTFVWGDFSHYAVGILAGGLLAQAIRPRPRASEPESRTPDP
jgi:hypothetical protein